MICEIIDGYRNDLIKYNIINMKNNKVMNYKIELHDWCEGYLRSADI